jgi:superfamily II DNA or RNA helicase
MTHTVIPCSISCRAGAVGINLTQANRVFIMEPFLNPALEAQAIGRVHRLGQKRPVEIIRLIVVDSIETRLQSVIAKRTGGKNPPGSSAGDDGVESSRDNDGVNPDEDYDKKPAAVTTVDPSRQQSVATPLIGSISADKAIVAAEEFDCLYGFTNEAGDGSDAETDDGPNVC